MKKVGILLLVGFGAFGEISVSPEFTRVYGSFTVKGSLFGSCEEVLIEGCGVKGTTTTSNDGVFSFTSDVPLICGGEYVITATGKERIDTGRIWIVPSVFLSPNSGSFGDLINISGVGYGPKERIQIGMGRQNVLAEAYTSELGTFSAKFNVLNFPRGENRLFAIGHGTYLLAEEGFIVKPRVLLNPGSGCVDSSIFLSGSGLTPNDEVRIGFGKIGTISTSKVDRDGSFQIGFSCPKLSGGNQIVLIESPDFIETLSFSIKPRLISTIPNRGYVFGRINLELDGLTPNEVLTMSFDKEYATWTINNDGTFSDSFVISTTPGGIKVITITTESGIFHTQIFEIRPSISFLTPTEPKKGEVITFTGFGFLPNEKIRVDFGRHEAILWKDADENGIFEGEYTIEDSPGSYRLVAIGYTTHQAGIINVNVIEEKEEPKEEKKE